MGKSLIIAEKPSVASDIAKALGGFAKSQDHFESESGWERESTFLEVLNPNLRLVYIHSPESDSATLSHLNPGQTSADTDWINVPAAEKNMANGTRNIGF